MDFKPAHGRRPAKARLATLIPPIYLRNCVCLIWSSLRDECEKSFSSLIFKRSSRRVSGEKFLDHLPVDICESPLDSVVVETELFVIDTQQV